MLSNTEVLMRLGVAAALGSVVGFERERVMRAAGIRTHMLVCVGSALFMLVSAYGFADALGGPHAVLDPSRVAAQVVSGIGFLGAGAILARGDSVRGLTTAASIWTVAAIGLAVGGGLYFAAVVSTGVILVILAGLKPVEDAYRARNQSVRLRIDADGGALTPEILTETLNIRPGRIKRFLAMSRDHGAREEITLVLTRVSSKDIKALVRDIGGVAGVRDVEVASREHEQRTTN